MNKAMDVFLQTFQTPKPVIGMVHLPPLPGSPRYNGERMAEVADYAVQEAKKLEKAGFNGLNIENYGDVMFNKTARPETIASLTYVAKQVREHTALPIGICVLQTDAIAALAIAQVVEAQFVRLPYYTEVYVVDVGLMESCAAEALRYRKFLGSKALIFADVHIKHGYPLSQRPIEEAAEDIVHRGMADAVIVTGRKTGGPTKLDDIQKVKRTIPNTPVLVGSGVRIGDVEAVLGAADGAVVGSSLKKDGDTESEIDPAKAEALMAAVRKLRGAR